MGILPRHCCHQSGKMLVSLLFPLMLVGLFAGKTDIDSNMVPTDLPPKQTPLAPALPLPHVGDSQFRAFNPNQFVFGTSEIAQRTFGWSEPSVSGLTFPAPPLFDNASANVTVRVANVSVTEQLIESTGSWQRTNQIQAAQGFYLPQNVILTNLSIFNDDKTNGVNASMQIRREFPNGTAAYSFNIWMWSNGNSTNLWRTINFSDGIFLEEGKYYLWMDGMSVISNSYSMWMHKNGASSNPDVWEFNGITWAPTTSNYSLILYYQVPFNPQTVEMTIANQPVASFGTGDGTGWANVTGNIVGSNLTFPVASNTSIAYSYSGEVTYYRTANTTNTVTLTSGTANWTLVLPLTNPGEEYHSYVGNVTGIKGDYTEISAYLGTSGVGFTPIPSKETLSFTASADRLTFSSPNMIQYAEFPAKLHSGMPVDINLSLSGSGNVTVDVYNGSLSYYANQTLDSSGIITLHWIPSTDILSGSYSFEAVFLGNSEVGFYSQSFTIERVAAISSRTVRSRTLQDLLVDCRFYDIYTGTSITGAQVNYILQDLTGALEYVTSGNYSKTIGLGTYSLLPGTYALMITANKPGYNEVVVTVPVILEPRELILSVGRSVTQMLPGGSLHLTISVRDKIEGEALLRPVGITVIIYKGGGNPTSDGIVTISTQGIISDTSLDITLPISITEGEYDMYVITDNPYYIGNIVIPGALRIESAFMYWIYGGSAGIVFVLGASAYVHLEKNRTKRSVKGLMILHTTGAPVAEHISPSFSKMDTVLISGAIAGIIALIREITGRGLRTIRIEGGYLELNRGESFWSVLLMRKKSTWIRHTIEQMVADIERHHGAALRECCNGERIPIDIPEIVARHFGVNLDDTRNFRTATRPEDHENDLLPPNKGGTPLSGL